MSRSSIKGPYLQFKKEQVMSRNSTILPMHLGSTYKVSNGLNFKEVLVTKDRMGRKFGEFSWSKTNQHGSKN